MQAQERSPGDILDTRFLAGDPEGERVEWRLTVNEDSDTDAWHPYQIDEKGEVAGNPVWAPLPGSQHVFLQCPVFEALYEGNRGPGKRLENNESVLTDSGWMKVGDVSMGDQLVAPDGTYTRIKGIHPHEKGAMYQITFEDGSGIKCDGDHLWTVRSAKNSARDGWLTRDTNQLIDLLKQSDGKHGAAKNSWYIPTMSAPAPGRPWSGPDPYVLGLILGDGTLSGKYTTVYTDDEETRDYLKEVHGWKAYRYSYSTVWMMQSTKSHESQAWKDALHLEPYSKARGKRVPDELLHADPDARLACLQGLMDADGSVDEQGRCRFVSLSERLAKHVQYLVRSLGGKSRCYWEYRKSPKGGVDGRWRVNVQHCNKFNPFRLSRKANRVKAMKGVDRRIVSILQVEDAPATCFEVAHPSHLFVCQDFIVTHNTLTLIMDFAREVGKGYGRSWRGILFRREYKELDDVVKKIEEWFPLLFPGFRFLHSKAEYMAVWPTGETLMLRAGEDEEVYKTFHGHEYPWIGFEELTQWEDDTLFLKMQSCCRSSTPNMPCRVRSSTNPYGPGHNWVKQRYGLPRMRGRVIQPPGEMPRVAIHGYLKENFLLLHATPNYITVIRNSTKNPNERKAWIDGDWDVTAGGMVDDLWRDIVHIVPTFPISDVPPGWTLTRAYDHGQSHPFAVGWWLESNGEPIEVDGRRLGTVRGDLFLWREWYGTSGEANTGVRMASKKIAHGICDREEDWGVRQPAIVGDRSQDICRVFPGPADTEIYNTLSDRDGRCPADDMEDAGVYWERADKSRGSRKRGWEMLRTLLEGAVPDPDGLREDPGIFICECCVHFLELVPVMPRDKADPDEVPKKYEDHIADMVRYRITWEMPVMFRRGF